MIDGDDAWGSYQDLCLMNILDGYPLPAHVLVSLPPWRALLIARIAAKAGVSIEGGTIDQLASAVRGLGGSSRIVWPPR